MKDTYMAKEAEVSRDWWVVDASDVPLGRLSTFVARILRGKHKPTFTPHVDTGDFVIVVNADKVVLTGRKAEQKFYHRHSNYPGGLKSTAYGELLRKKPAFVVEKAVKGMLPKNKLGRRMAKKLKAYAGPDHPHEAQSPKPLEVEL
ncbi:MAG: 50S ribosomal protein L13 [Bacillota bacterium]